MNYVFNKNAVIFVLIQAWTRNMVRKEDHGWVSTSGARWLQSPTTWKDVPTLMRKEEVSFTFIYMYIFTMYLLLPTRLEELST